MSDREPIDDELMGFQRIDPKEVEVGMEVKVLYDSTFGGQVYREGTVTEFESMDTDFGKHVRIEMRHSEHRATIIGGSIREHGGRTTETYRVSSESSVRTTGVGELLAMYGDPESI
ncbi:hypothetical protein NDI76_05720 [Halogeometricum sp. S1BR25-6]|uniref:Uncharacterized protein n=1 Tax=Halogeometricum salsisoli TaxID=2950536 RepID=A0ABU2GBP0_9EURY|nr:hypothetical protein [Halogeometricum sp. S1BR25-6]MDS0298233.1 hypothetical protein [Halogeometricum sp. S1BR25-6]